jgi:serine/threonine-protein kinase
MELVQQETLAQRIRRGPIQRRVLVDIARQLAGAVAYAHEHGVLHGDLKSTNVMVTPGGHVKILDFGLARRLTASGTVESSRSGGEDTVEGTLAYMAPELLRYGRPDVRTDLWAIGVLLYEMVTGTRPFAGATELDLASAILTEPPRPLPANVPVPLAEVIDRCLMKDPARRCQTAIEVEQALERSPASGDAEEWSRPAPGRRRSLVFAVLLLLSGLGTWGVKAPDNRSLSSVAVLPLENLSGDASEDSLSNGMTEALITELARIERLRVISRTSVMQFRGPRSSIGSIGHSLHVDGILEGSVRRSGSRVGVTVRLIEVASDRQLWAQSYERELGDVLELHRQIAEAAAAEISRTLHLPFRAVPRQIKPDVYDVSVRGRRFWNVRTEQEVQISIRDFEEARRRDFDGRSAAVVGDAQLRGDARSPAWRRDRALRRAGALSRGSVRAAVGAGRDGGSLRMATPLARDRAARPRADHGWALGLCRVPPLRDGWATDSLNRPRQPVVARLPV